MLEMVDRGTGGKWWSRGTPEMVEQGTVKKTEDVTNQCVAKL